MSRLTETIARWLCPKLAEKADRYESLTARMGSDYWWLGGFPDASDTIRHYLDSEHNRWRAIGEPARGNLPDDISGFREHLRRRATLARPAALVAAERERCAAIADCFADAYHLEDAQYRSVAAAIRQEPAS